MKDSTFAIIFVALAFLGGMTWHWASDRGMGIFPLTMGSAAFFAGMTLWLVYRLDDNRMAGWRRD